MSAPFIILGAYKRPHNNAGIANDDGIVDKSEFVILCMVRTGAASPDLIKLILAHFDDLDVDGDGGLRMSEICRDVSMNAAKKRGSMEQTINRAVKRASLTHSSVVLHVGNAEESADESKASSANPVHTPFDISTNGGHIDV